MTRVIVVGASSGLGAELTRQLASSGAKVIAVARRKCEASENVVPLQHDVTETATTEAAFEEACRILGGLDMIIYCAGVMPRVELNEFNTDKDLAMIQTNLEGAVAWLNLAANRFQSIGAGTIVGISSVAGDRGRAGQPVYNASKAALATYLESLRNRLWSHGVKVVTIKPGPLVTPMTEGLELKGAMSVEEAARKTIAKSRRSGEHYLKFSHRVIFALIRILPAAIIRRIP